MNSLDINAIIKEARAIKVPMALGERLERLERFADLLALRMIDVIQPEVIHLGLSNITRVCGLVEAYGALVDSY